MHCTAESPIKNWPWVAIKNWLRSGTTPGVNQGNQANHNQMGENTKWALKRTGAVAIKKLAGILMISWILAGRYKETGWESG